MRETTSTDRQRAGAVVKRVRRRAAARLAAASARAMPPGGTGLGPAPAPNGLIPVFSGGTASDDPPEAGAGGTGAGTPFRGVGMTGVVPNRVAGRTVVRYEAADGAAIGPRSAAAGAVLRRCVGAAPVEVHRRRRDERVRRHPGLNRRTHGRAALRRGHGRDRRRRGIHRPAVRPRRRHGIQDRRDRSDDRPDNRSNHVDDRLERLGDGGDDGGDGVDDRLERLGDGADDGGDGVDDRLQRLGDVPDDRRATASMTGSSGSVTAGIERRRSCR